jgi:aminoglycoside phosphotransferase (APT) family kinase protein
MPGKRLNEAWWDMAEKEKEHVATRVSEICSELQAFRSNVLTGTDHDWIDPLREQRDYGAEALQKHCEELGMDCSTFVLSHNDLGPTNIIVNGDRIAVLDWELAGYCPLAWVRTKFAICGALQVERVRITGVETNSEYRVRVERKLGDMGFPEVTEAYQRVKKARYREWKRNRPWLR